MIMPYIIFYLTGLYHILSLFAPHHLTSHDILLFCIILYCFVLYCIVLYCIVLYYIVLYRIHFMGFNLVVSTYHLIWAAYYIRSSIWLLHLVTHSSNIYHILSRFVSFSLLSSYSWFFSSLLFSFPFLTQGMKWREFD